MSFPKCYLHRYVTSLGITNTWVWQGCIILSSLKTSMILPIVAGGGIHSLGPSSTLCRSNRLSLVTSVRSIFPQGFSPSESLHQILTYVPTFPTKLSPTPFARGKTKVDHLLPSFHLASLLLIAHQLSMLSSRLCSHV